MTYGIEYTESGPEPLAMYSDEEDAVTRVADVSIPEPRWIVQITALDRRMLDTAELLAEARRGELVHAETLVWRGGMQDWQPCAEALTALRRELPTLAPRAIGVSSGVGAPASQWSSEAAAALLAQGVFGDARRSGSARLGAGAGVWASIAIVLSAAALTISVLAMCGVFSPAPVASSPPAAGTPAVSAR